MKVAKFLCLVLRNVEKFASGAVVAESQLGEGQHRARDWQYIAKSIAFGNIEFFVCNGQCFFIFSGENERIGELLEEGSRYIRVLRRGNDISHCQHFVK